MQDSTLWTSFAVLALLVIFAVIFLVVRKYRGKKRPVDYYTLFIIGILWTVGGLIPNNFAFLVMGVAFMVIGLVHKSEWKKNRKDWKNMTKKDKIMGLLLKGPAAMAIERDREGWEKEKKNMKWVIIGLILAAIAGGLFAVLFPM